MEFIVVAAGIFGLLVCGGKVAEFYTAPAPKEPIKPEPEAPEEPDWEDIS